MIQIIFPHFENFLGEPPTAKREVDNDCYYFDKLAELIIVSTIPYVTCVTFGLKVQCHCGSWQVYF